MKSFLSLLLLFSLCSLLSQQISADEKFAGRISVKRFVLITPEEARLPGPKLDSRRKGLSSAPMPQRETSGPVLRFINPADGSSVTRPLSIKITFEKNKAPIDLSTVKVSYLKLFSIDITDRIKPYVKENGIDVLNADIPEGDHRLEFSLSDTEGNTTEKILRVTVE